MKQYHKLQLCPYKTSDDKCTHKHPSIKKSKRKHFCSHIKPNNCQMYNEWLELKEEQEDSLKDELGYICTEGE